MQGRRAVRGADGGDYGIRDGDVAAFERAYDEHARAVYRAAIHVLGDPVRAQDVVQDVFLGLWRRPERFDPERGGLCGYLKLIARSRALDICREGQVASRATERLRIMTAADGGRVEERPAAMVERRQEFGSVQRALRRVPAAQREAIVMAYWGGLTADQIAERLAVPLGTIKSRIRLGLLRLREECAEVAAAA